MSPTMVICHHPRLPVIRYRAHLIGSIKMGIAEIQCEFRQDATLDVFLTVHHSIDFSKYQLSAQFF